MAVDTRNKRFSLLGFGQAQQFPYVVPNPDGTIDSNDRYHFVYLYAGIVLQGGPTDVQGNGSLNQLWRHRRGRGQ